MSPGTITLVVLLLLNIASETLQIGTGRLLSSAQQALLPILGQLFFLALGSGMTVIGSWTIQYYTDERTRRRIRKMVKVEVEAAQHRLQSISNGLESEALLPGRTDNLLSTNMYDQHLVEIGVLSEREIKYASEYYRRVDRMADYQAQYLELMDSKDEFDEEWKFEIRQQGIKEEAAEEAEDALIQQTLLLDELEEKLDTSWPINW